MTIKIGKMIMDVRSKLLTKASASDATQLWHWQLVRHTRNWPHGATNSATVGFTCALMANDLNACFAVIAADEHYSRDTVDECLRSFGNKDLSSFVPFSADFITTVLSRVRSSSPGPEGIPHWVYKSFAEELGPAVAKLVSF